MKMLQKIFIYLAMFIQSGHPPLQVTKAAIKGIRISSLKAFCCGLIVKLQETETVSGRRLCVCEITTSLCRMQREDSKDIKASKVGNTLQNGNVKKEEV